MAQITTVYLAIGILLGFANIDHFANAEPQRKAKFSIFNIIKFENNPCVGGTRNGTCFTEAECDDQGGEEDGECADGFGVCCIKTLECGQSVSLNTSFIVKTTSDTITQPSCNYQICPCSSDVCRIKFDFTTFVIAGPVTATTVAATAGAAAVGTGGTIGDCVTDTANFVSPGGKSSPIICGTNTGQHVFLDSNGNDCVSVNFAIGSTASTVSWDIKVTQYLCGNEMGGPQGCLQYFNSISGSGQISSFNYPVQASGTALADTVTHLSSQDYSACIRREATRTHICYIPCTTVTMATAGTGMQSSFGLSVSDVAGIAAAAVDTECSTDFIEVVGANVVAIAAMTNAIVPIGNRFCGRYFNTRTSDGAAPISLCTRSQPFKVGVFFDQSERTDASAMPEFGEEDGFPGGIIGFCLDFAQL